MSVDPSALWKTTPFTKKYDPNVTPYTGVFESNPVKLPDAKRFDLGAGVKNDAEKPRMDLLDSDALEGIAQVLTFGAKKYAAHNWREGISNSRLVAALLRHLFAIMKGEYNDPESGLPHIDHVGCCWMFISWNMKNREDLNDLWRPKNETVQ